MAYNLFEVNQKQRFERSHSLFFLLADAETWCEWWISTKLPTKWKRTQHKVVWREHVRTNLTECGSCRPPVRWNLVISGWWWPCLGDGLAAITQAWSPSSTYQQLLTVWWVPQQLLQKAIFDTFTFEGGGGGWDTKSFNRTDPIFNFQCSKVTSRNTINVPVTSSSRIPYYLSS